VAEEILVGIVLAICGVLMLRLLLGERRRYRFDAALRRFVIASRIRALRVWHWRSARRQAKRDAEESIRRAREGEWDGNVYKSKSFKRPRKLH
jgi:hypothetical protein